jgi:hypothetical protein
LLAWMSLTYALRFILELKGNRKYGICTRSHHSL